MTAAEMTGTDRERGARLERAVRANAVDLLAYLERRIDTPADAADALGETLLQVWRRRAKMPADDEALRPWLFAFARNTLLNARKASRRRTAGTTALRGYLAAAHPAVVDHAESLAVREAVAALGPDLRELVLLVHWEGLSISDAAVVLDIPASTARSRYAVAKARLRDELDEAPQAGQKPGGISRA
ncbi:RNA polymerase sigma factor [Agromyces cerinus]|uniref:RNA polymerase sigma-70 factor, ECF subfamily n=1 Tax=Agromyces cerinus subsp. cerinus TaxID=232089 RepID=A0A1N6ESE2_9MICO|nr:RNA polymerase sigma factor [Agromyces cerinus]SIN86032.1 RNA polymerase sigma-70 factor, ECF subfamily [Agromyces cerinus subsp. cerinus]